MARGTGVVVAAVVVAACVGAGPAGCSSGMKVTTRCDAGADFSAYRTYAWGEGGSTGAPGRAALKPESEAAIREELAAGLAGVGLTPAPAGAAPDAIVQYDVAVQDESRTASWPALGSRYSRPGEWDQWSYRYREGALGVDIVDAKTGRAVWRGVAEAELYGPGEARRQVHEAVTKMFAKYPGE